MPKGLRPITTYNVFGNDKVVTTAAAITSQPFDLRECAQDGLFSIQYANTATGSGTLALTYTVCSVSGGTYFTPTGGGSIVSGLGTASGGLAFEPEMYPFIKIVATSTTDTNTCTVYLNIQ